MSTEFNDFTGIFTWKNNATIDGTSRKITRSNIYVDDYDVDEQKMYLIYPRGTHIYHDPKVGIEGIYRILPIVDDPLFLIILLALISSLSISIGYAFYHYRERIFSGHYSELDIKKDIRLKNVNFSSDRVDSLLNNKKILNQLKEMSSTTEKIKLTALSQDFYKIISMFEWDDDDLVDFIREMIALTPEERKSIFNEMINKSEQQKKNRLDDTKRLYT